MTVATSHTVHSEPTVNVYELGDVPVTKFYINTSALQNNTQVGVEIVPGVVAGKALVHWWTECYIPQLVRDEDLGGIAIITSLVDIPLNELVALSALFNDLESYLQSAGATIDFSSGFLLTGQALVEITNTPPPAPVPISTSRRRDRF